MPSRSFFGRLIRQNRLTLDFDTFPHRGRLGRFFAFSLRSSFLQGERIATARAEPRNDNI